MSEVELTIVTMQFDASDPDALQSVLAKYTVLTRMDPGVSQHRPLRVGDQPWAVRDRSEMGQPRGAASPFRR